VSHPVDEQIHALHRQLSGLPQAEPETQQQLLILQADINRLLDGGEAVAETSPGDAVESLAARFDADHPSLSAALRSVVDTLGKAGI
jgi:Domain of unknown function (DUF4404)